MKNLVLYIAAGAAVGTAVGLIRQTAEKSPAGAESSGFRIPSALSAVAGALLPKVVAAVQDLLADVDLSALTPAEQAPAAPVAPAMAASPSTHPAGPEFAETPA